MYSDTTEGPVVPIVEGCIDGTGSANGSCMVLHMERWTLASRVAERNSLCTTVSTLSANSVLIMLRI